MANIRRIWQTQPFLGAMVIISVAFWALWAYLRMLGFDFFLSDVKDYWKDSLNWRHPFNVFHVPGYPLVLAGLRGLTFGTIPPLVIMRGITFLALLTGAGLTYALLRREGIEPRHASLGMLLFAFWPFVGLVYSVWPVADIFAITIFLGGLYALVQARMVLAALLLGLTLIVQKALWPFVGFAAVLAFWHSPRQNMVVFFLLLLIPLGALFIAGTLYHGSPTWILAGDLRVEIASRSRLPILDGIVGSLFHRGMKGIVRSGIILAVAAAPAFTLAIGSRFDTQESRLSLAISGAVLLLCLFLNQAVIWAVLDFSRLLVVPMLWRIHRTRPSLLENTQLWTLIISGMLVSQFAFAWYMATVFFI